jgi:hypothetical protein
MKAYNLILLAIASMAMAAETTGQQLTTLATVEVQADPTPTAAAETVGTTDAPAATDTVEAESSEYAEDDSEAGNEVGTAVGGEGTGLNVTSEADLPAAFKGQSGNAAVLDEGDPPEDKSSVEARGWGNHGVWHPNKPNWCFGPYNIFNLRFGVLCPYYTKNWARFHRKKLHVDVRIWQRKGNYWHPWWKKVLNLQITRYTHHGRECGYIRDQLTNHIIYDRCMWWSWSQMAKKLTKVTLHQVQKVFIHASWPSWLIHNVIGGMFWPVYTNCVMKLKLWH